MSSEITTKSILEIITKQESIEILRGSDDDKRKPFALAKAVLNEDDKIELSIFSCSKPDSFVVGSAEKLILAFIDVGYAYQIVAFCDIVSENHILVDGIGDIAKTQLRKFFRIDTPMEYSVHECNFAGKPFRELEVESGADINISGGGVRFNSHDPLQTNAIVKIELNLGNKNTVTMKGKVVRCYPDESKRGWFYIAIAFVDISKFAQDIILEFVSGRQRSQIKRVLSKE